MSSDRSWSPLGGRGHAITLIHHADAATVELRLHSPAAPTFSVETLDAMSEIFDQVAHDAERFATSPPRYLLLTSAVQAVFSMGGDLQTIAELAHARDAHGAASYGRKAAHIIHRLYAGLGLDLVTVACVGGKAFGAGFEAALACDRIAAHRAATFCLPESRFGLFPGMGATSLLSRRIGGEATDRMLAERSLVSAAEAHEMGLVSALTDDDPTEAELAAARSGGERRWRDLLREADVRRAREAFGLEEVLGTTAAWARRVATMAAGDLDALARVARVQRARSGVASA